MTKKEIAERNDALRASIPRIAPPNLLVMTGGISSLAVEHVDVIMEKVKTFDDFSKDNDPHKEHDFGAFTFHNSKVMWKIDDYAGHDGFELVLTVMLAEEY